ncbi:MAG: hypothetical protein ABID87_08070 [Chloroflexota bacterium]
MDEATGYLELAALNSEIAEAYLAEASAELASVLEKLEDCQKLISILREQPAPLSVPTLVPACPDASLRN